MVSKDYGNAVHGNATQSTASNHQPQSTAQPNALRQSSVAGSWLETFQSLTGSKPHKPSFVIFEIGQSGLITLEKWFAAHDNIVFQENVLSQPVRFPRMSIYQRIRQSKGDVYGFNLTVQQLREVQRLADPNQFLHDLYRGGCRVMYLNRRDMLRHAIATLRIHSFNNNFENSNFSQPDRHSQKHLTQRHLNRLSGNKLSANKITIDVSELLDCLRYLDNQRLEANAILHDLPHLNIVYEDDLMDPNKYAQTAQRLCEFLDIPDIKPAGSTLKLVHQRLTDIVNNYDEVCSGLEASEYAYLLTDSRHLLTL